MLAGKLYLDGHRKKSSNVERPSKKESHKSLVKYFDDQIAPSRAIFTNAQICNQLITNRLDHLNYRSFSSASSTERFVSCTVGYMVRFNSKGTKHTIFYGDPSKIIE